MYKLYDIYIYINMYIYIYIYMYIRYIYIIYIYNLSGLTNYFLFFFFISWNGPLWSAGKYLWWRLILCGGQIIDLQDELTGWFLYGFGLFWRSF